VADGAMGTALYAKGVFINRCYDELNLSLPALVRDVHQEYVKAGAEILETNTFGANRKRLAAFGFADKVRLINQAGVRIAREAARDQAFVAGAVGPLGIRLEPETQKPRTNPETLESDRPGIFLAGVIVAGMHTNEIFIENGRFHGQKIAEAIAESLSSAQLISSTS